MSRLKKIDNPNLIPRDPSTLPDLEEVTAEYQPTIDKICHDIKKNFYRQIKVFESSEEIYQTVMMVYYEMWNWYKAGATPEFPPPAGYLYVTSWRKFMAQWCPTDDIFSCKIYAYNTIEVPIDAKFTGNMIIIDPLYKEIATQNQQIPFSEPKDEEDFAFGTIPDMLDFWYLGFTINELAVIYNYCPNTIRERLHNFYDAVEAIGGKTFRPRPYRRKRKKNRFKNRKNRK